MQQIFLSYTYKPHPDFVDEAEQLQSFVSTVIESMELRVVTGEDLGGHTLTDEIRKRIQKSDALIALVTPWRDSSGNTVVPPWVNDEFVFAKASHGRAFRVVHKELAIGGMYAGDEYMCYSKAEMAVTLLKLMKTLAIWKKESGRPMQIELGLDQEQQNDRRRVDKCEYQLLRNYEEGPWRNTSVWPQPGALYAYVPGVPDGAQLRLRLQIGGEHWESAFQTPFGRVHLSRRQP